MPNLLNCRPEHTTKDEAMPTRNVVLTAHHESVIAALVNTGRYQNASEVLREGLRLVEAREARDAAKLKALQGLAATGFADLDEGRHRDLQDAELEDFIAGLGRLAGRRVLAAAS
jgi:antitoxin ParD1/3/4